MRRPTILTLSAFLLATAAGPAATATLGVTFRDAPVISGAGTAFHDPLLGFDLLGDGAASSTPPAAAADLLVTVPFADLTAPQGALFVSTGTGASFLSGDLTKVGYTVDPAGDDTIELLFGNLDGASANAFRPLALLALAGEFGEDPVGAGFGSFANPVDVDFSVAAVPLPASLPLLFGGIGCLYVVHATRRRIAR